MATATHLRASPGLTRSTARSAAPRCRPLQARRVVALRSSAQAAGTTVQEAINATASAPTSTNVGGTRSDTSSDTTAAQDAAASVGSFNWLAHWYPVHVLEMVDPARPHAIEVLGKQLVLWRDGGGRWQVFEDACPHRLAPLSEGRIEADGTLQCSYHGWRFDSSGRCTEIPQAIDAKAKATACSSSRSCVTSYPVREDAGLIWLWPTPGAAAAAAAAAAPTPVSKAMREACDQGKIGKAGRWYRRCLPMSLEVLLENLNDPSHLPFSHHNLSPMLQRSKGKEMPFRSVLESLPAGSSAEDVAARPPYCRLDSLPVSAYEFPSAMSPEGLTAFSPPGLVIYRYKLPTGATIHTELLAMPAGPGRSVVYTGSVNAASVTKTTLADIAKAAVTAPKALPLMLARRAMQSAPIYQTHIFSSKLFDQDNLFLAMQDRMLAQRSDTWQDAYYMPTPCDGSVIAARRWLTKALRQPLSPSVTAADVISMPQAAPPVNKRQVNDRFEQHTKHCVVCQKAMKQFEARAAAAKLLAAALGAAAVGLLAGVLLPAWVGAAAPGAAAAGTGAWGWVTALCAVAAAIAAAVARASAAKVQQFVYVEFAHAQNH